MAIELKYKKKATLLLAYYVIDILRVHQYQDFRIKTLKKLNRSFRLFVFLKTFYTTLNTFYVFSSYGQLFIDLFN